MYPAIQASRRAGRLDGSAGTIIGGISIMPNRLDHWLNGAFRRLLGGLRASDAKPNERGMRDQLTGLPDRAGACAHLDRYLADHDTVAALGGIALLLIGLDEFDSIIRRLGTDGSDTLLRQVARRTRASLRDTDYVARLDVDIFLVALPQESDRENAAIVARKLVAALQGVYEVNGTSPTKVTASVGVSRYPSDARDREMLMKCAEQALSEAKRAGGNTFRIFDSAA